MEYKKISGFTDEITSSIEGQINGMKELGISYMSIRGIGEKNIGDFSPEEFEKEIYPKLKDSCVKISSIGSPIGKIYIDDEVGFNKQIIVLENLCKICKIADVKYIRIFSFYIPKGENPDKYEDLVIKKLTEFIKIAAKYDICLIHENEKDIYGDVAYRCKNLIDELRSENFALIFDFANYVQVKEDTLKAYKLLKDDIIYVHIKDAKYDNDQNVVAGTGDGNIREILEDLFNSNYDGFLTLEPHLVKFDSLKSLEINEVDDIIKEDLADNGFEGFKMQLEALKIILKEIDC